MFRVRPLCSEGSYPPSIPLVLPSGYECDVASGTVRRKPPRTAPATVGEEAVQQPEQLVLVPEALRLLEGIEKPVAILSICGPYRSGKSSFMSRVLGIPNAFEASNGISACTRGVWMATTVLECEDRVIVLLDTEGTDGICSGSELLSKTRLSYSILVLTTVLSSQLIYNSMQIPRRSDLDTMSCFADLASSIRTSASSSEVECHQHLFPHFLWLLRDATLELEGEDGSPVTLGDYIRSYLQTESSPENHDSVAHTLLNLFPSFECRQLPYPSKKDLQNDYSYSSEFSSDFDAVKQHILQGIRPKKVCGSDLNGQMIATLITKYVHSLNAPNSVPDLANGWKFAIKYALTKKLDNLVCKYNAKMAARLSNSLPLEEDDDTNQPQQTLQPPTLETSEIHRRSPESRSDRASPKVSKHRKKTPSSASPSRSKRKPRRHRSPSSQRQASATPPTVTPTAKPTLFSIHKEALTACKEELVWEIDRFMSISNTEKEEIVRDFESRIVCYNENNEITGGAYFTFVQMNRAESLKRCRALFNDLAHPLSENFEQSLSSINNTYQSRAIGPAKNEVYDTQRAEFEYHTKYLVPSAPSDMANVGRSPNQLKIKWHPPERHKQVARNYEVQMQGPDGEWRTIVKTERLAVVISGLKSSTKYLFRVRVLNTRVAGEWTPEFAADTRLSKSEQAAVVAASFVGGTVGAPFILTGASVSYGVKAWKESTDDQTKALAATGIAVGITLLPFMFCYYAVATPGPVVGLDMARMTYDKTRKSDEDDLSTTDSEYVDISVNTRRESSRPLSASNTTDETQRSLGSVVGPESSATATQFQAFSAESQEQPEDSQSISEPTDDATTPPAVYTFGTYGGDDVDSLSSDEAFHSNPNSQPEQPDAL